MHETLYRNILMFEKRHLIYRPKSCINDRRTRFMPLFDSKRAQRVDVTFMDMPSLSLSLSFSENVTAQSKLIGEYKFARALPPRHYSKFVAAGYYTIEQRSKKYRIVFLNTNLWLNPLDSRMLHRAGSSTVDNTQDPFGQWSWFQSVLENARKKKEAVRLILCNTYMILLVFLEPCYHCTSQTHSPFFSFTVLLYSHGYIRRRNNSRRLAVSINDFIDFHRIREAPREPVKACLVVSTRTGNNVNVRKGCERKSRTTRH